MNALMVVGVIVNAFVGLVYGLAGGHVGFAVYTLIAVGISVVGMIVIATGSKKTGAILVIIGAIGFVPIGLIAIFGARRVLNEAKWEQASMATRHDQDSSGKSAFDYAQHDNEKLKGTDVHQEFQKSQEGSQLAAASRGEQTKDFFELVKTGTPQDVQSAINEGADLKAREQDRGRTPLMAAAAWNPNPEVITMLVKAGADLKARDENGATVLMAATYNTNLEVITTTLLNAGAEVNVQNNVGMTPLIMFAARGNTNPAVITTLLKAGANAKVKDEDGKTAVDYAKHNEKLEGTDALKQLEEASR